MKKTILLVSLLLAAFNSAQALTILPADVMYCTFTEPFINITFEPETGKVAYSGWDTITETPQNNSGVILEETNERVLTADGKLVPVVAAGESVDQFYAIFGSKFELQNENGNVLMSLTLDMQGSDGMSDNQYPFSAVYGGNFGGCETQRYPAVNSVEIFEGLKR